MFQYAFAYVLSKRFGCEVTLDLSWFEESKNHKDVTLRPFELNVFDLKYESATKEDLAKVILQKHRSKPQRFLGDVLKIDKYKPTGNTFVQIISSCYDEKLLANPDYYYYDGYFQSEKYFKEERKNLLQCFNSSMALDEKNLQMLAKINETDSISLHVRRGDYVTLECAKQFHGTCPIEFYHKAIELVAKRVRNPHIFLFSDDICWVVKNLNIEYPYTIVDINQDRGWFDLNLMKHCKHNIIANSSFSWWGAWLNENPSKIVVAPKKWTLKNPRQCKIVPEEWIKI